MFHRKGRRPRHKPERQPISKADAEALDRAAGILLEFDEINVALDLVGYVIHESCNIPPGAKFSNVVAGLAPLARAHHDLQAAITLSQFHLYTQALALLRSVYEAAGIGRTMAHSTRTADLWVAGRWQPDSKSRQYVRDVMHADSTPEEKDEAVAAYAESYEVLSRWAHVTATSALVPYITESGNGYSVELSPKFDADFLRFTLASIAAESIFLADATKNAVAEPAILGEAWHGRLSDIRGRFIERHTRVLAEGYDRIEREREQLAADIKNSSELNSFLKRSPNTATKRLPDNLP